MLAAHQNETVDSIQKQELKKKYTETLLNLAIKWNSWEGMKQLLTDIEEAKQVSLFLRILPYEYVSSRKRIVHA